MKIIETVAAVHQHVRTRSRETQTVLVPTMGALHRGHQELIRIARDHAGEKGEVALSIFVNALQFEPGSDFERYPRPQIEDEAICRTAGVDLLFRPSAEEMYFSNQSIYVDETSLSSRLCGASRRGHFRGVCTVVAKLFNLLAPDVAVFGEKDYQQLVIVRRLVRDLNFPIQIVGVPTLREPDGLALSSRNAYLNEDERAQARLLRRAALTCEQLVRAGETSVETLMEVAKDVISGGQSTRIDYVEIVDGETLQPLTDLRPNAVLALAVFVGRTRLIDNLRLT